MNIRTTGGISKTQLHGVSRLGCEAVQSGRHYRHENLRSSILQASHGISAIVARDIVGSSGRRLGEVGRGKELLTFSLKRVRWLPVCCCQAVVVLSSWQLVIAGLYVTSHSNIAMEHDRPSHRRAEATWKFSPVPGGITAPHSVTQLCVFVAVFAILAGLVQPTLSGENTVSGSMSELLLHFLVELSNVTHPSGNF